MTKWDKSKLPSRHTTVGPDRAPHRSYYYAMGLTEAEIDQPFVGVATCWNEAAPCNIDLSRQAQSVKKGVKEADGHAARIHHHHGDRRHRHGPPGDEVLARLARRHRRHGRTHRARPLLRRAGRPGGLRQVAAGHDDGDAAAEHPERLHVWRLDPAGQVQGPRRHGGRRVRGRRPARRRQHVGRGTARARMRRLPERRRLRRPVHRQHHGDASREAIGLALPGSAGTPAPYEERDRWAVEVGQGGDEPAEAEPPPARHRHARSRWRMPRSWSAPPAARTNAGLHLPAMAHEAGIDFTMDDVVAIMRRTPYIADLKPGGKYVAYDVYKVGGIPVIIKALLDAGLLHGDCMTVTGKTLAENHKDVVFPLDQDVIFPVSKAISTTGGVVGAEGQPGAGRGDREDRRHEDAALRGHRAVLRQRGGSLRRGRCARLQGRRHHRHPLRGPEGRPRHARDAVHHRGHLRPGHGRAGGADHRWAVLRCHARLLHRPCRAGSRRRRADRAAARTATAS